MNAMLNETQLKCRKCSELVTLLQFEMHEKHCKKNDFSLKSDKDYNIILNSAILRKMILCIGAWKFENILSKFEAIFVEYGVSADLPTEHLTESAAPTDYDISIIMPRGNARNEHRLCELDSFPLYEFKPCLFLLITVKKDHIWSPTSDLGRAYSQE